MERPELERREKIVAGIVGTLVVGTGVALYARKDGRLFHARAYPAGGVIIDVLRDTKEKSIRIGATIKSLNPLKFEVDEAEHSESELNEVEELYMDALSDNENPLQTG